MATTEDKGVLRRDLLKGVAGGMLAATVAPNILTANAKDSQMSDRILGDGAHKYELVPDWGQLPEDKAYGYTHGVAVDSQGRVIIHHTGKDSVTIFDPTGAFIKAWGSEFEGGAHGLQLSKEGNEEFAYLADTKRRIVVKTTLDGEVVWTLEYPKDSGVYKSAEKYCPTNVAIAPNGDFYVADGYGSSYIHQYNAKAEYIRTWGGPGSEQGKMNCPHGIAVDTRGVDPKVLVADRANVRLQYFTLDGKPLTMVTEELRHPCHFDQRHGDLLIPDLHGRVTIFDKDDKLITHLGDNPGVHTVKGYPNLPHEERIPGKFISPHSACWDPDGNIYVVEWVNDGRITKLRHVS